MPPALYRIEPPLVAQIAPAILLDGVARPGAETAPEIAAAPVTASAFEPSVAPPRARLVPVAAPSAGVTNAGDVVAEIAPEPFNALPRAVKTFAP